MYVPPGLTFKYSTWCYLCVECLYMSPNRQRSLLYASLTDRFL